MSNELLGFTTESVLGTCSWSQSLGRGACARLIIKTKKDKLKGFDDSKPPLAWQSSEMFQTPMIKKFHTEKGITWVVTLDAHKVAHHDGQFEPSLYTMSRDTVGSLMRECASFPEVHLDFQTANSDVVSGAIVGVEMSLYRFKNCWPVYKKSEQKLFITSPLKNTKSIFENARALGVGTNMARHLVNLPPNVLNPTSYAKFAQNIFKGTNVKVEVWDFEKLKKEKMNLHASVGQGAESKPVLVRLQLKGGGKKPAQAFVGKGITFDSGGLDIKPAGGMRDMKKDMGGSAAVIGYMYWAQATKQKKNIDVYLAIAENSVDADSFRPSDVFTARNGKTVEIHNTDAEGRLVLADSLVLAAETKPEFIVDVSTLTGAIKVALGETTPGLFCNNDALSKKLLKAAQLSGDNCWRMPLDPTQKHKLKSDVADLSNAHEGFGGAVTAALFLEQFVNAVPWAHFDIYAWTSSGSGALSEKGGNGQIVQLLAFLA
jgi:leucyl aminopeptidase